MRNSNKLVSIVHCRNEPSLSYSIEIDREISIINVANKDRNLH